MTTYSRLFLYLALVSIPVMYAHDAEAVVIYDWSGQCAGNVTPGCSGTATGVLTLTDAYTPGTTVEASEFVSWSLDSNTIDYSFIASDLLSITAAGPLPIDSGVGSQLRLNFNPTGTDSNFFNAAETFWDSRTPNDGSSRLLGIEYSWTRRAQAPEPGVIALLALGMAGFGYQRRQHAKRHNTVR